MTETDGISTKTVADTIFNDIEERRLSLEERKFEEESFVNRKKLELEERLSILSAENQNKKEQTNPLLLALIGAFVAIAGGLVAAFANVGVSYINGQNQIAADERKHNQEIETEKLKAEATRILEAIKLGNPDQVSCVLKFYIGTGLINESFYRPSIEAYIRSRDGGAGVGSGLADQGCPPSISPVVATAKSQTQPSSSPPSSQQTPSEVISWKSAPMGGGHNQNEACETAKTENSSKYAGKTLRRLASDESSSKDLLGHVSYVYYCTLGVFEK